jgi:hypothetical protein
MKPELALVRQGELTPLLKSLYQTVEKKVHLEKMRVLSQRDVDDLRRSRTEITAASKAINKALNILKKAQQRYGEELTSVEVEDEVDGELILISFDEIVQYLEDALEVARNQQLGYVGMIHRGLRNRTEKKLAKKKLPSPGGDIEAGEIESHPYPARERSPDIDHWFIGAVAKCLDNYRTAERKPIPRYDKLISKLFEVAFHDKTRNEENIRTELRRQKQSASPSITFPFVGQENEVTSEWGQNSTTKRSDRPKMSGQKRKK